MAYYAHNRLSFQQVREARSGGPALLAAIFTTLLLSGCLGLGSLAVNPANVNFGNVPVGSSGTQTVTITNSSTSPFTLLQAGVSGEGFSLKSPPLPLTLAAGQSVSFTARFAPAAAGDTSGTLLITKNWTDSSQPQFSPGSTQTSSVIEQAAVRVKLAGAGVVKGQPRITTQPASQTVTAGQAASFTVAASGHGHVSYQWQKNGATISGATSPSYSTPVTATSDNGSQFIVVVSDNSGSITSNPATLTVVAPVVPPTITTQPASQTVALNQAALFSVVASGTGPLTYQWQKSGLAISGATASTYTTPATTSADNGSQFTVVISNSSGKVTSAAAMLTVKSAGQLSASPTSLSYGNVNVGTGVMLPVTVTNSGGTSVSISGVTLSGAGVSVSGVSSGLIIAAGNSALINVTFAPSASGTLSGSVTIASNASDPSVVISLSGTAVQPVSHSVTLSFAPNSSNVVGYNIYRSSTSNGPYTKLNSPILTSTAYTDSAVTASQTYYYVGTSVDSAGTETAYSSQVSATIPTP
jgi:Abnormal spindle-like microcephaly-assoc'd, ASPM-SPD-2-Hydin